MKKCKNCQKEIDDKAKKCPYCQTDLRSWFRRHPILTGLGAIMAFFIIVGALGSPNEEKSVSTNKPEPTQKETITEGTKNEGKETVKTPTITQKETKKEQPATATKSYQQVFTFSGNGVKKSEPFTITGDRFKIKYDCSGDLCQAFLKKPTSEWNIQLIMNSVNPVTDETIFYGAGEYYIDSNSMGSYSMVVEDYR